MPPRFAATRAPCLEVKAYRASSLFTPENLLREARRQKNLRFKAVPGTCVLDPDGDIVRHLVASGRAQSDPAWPCYHTELHVFRHAGQRFGIVGYAVGAPFAVLVAEELFASGCELLISITSAGEIVGVQKPPYFVLIDRAPAGRGHEPSLPNPGGLRPGRSAVDRADTRRAAAAGVADHPWRDVDNGCAVSGDSERNSRGPGPRCDRGRDGGSRPLYVRTDPPPGRGLLRARDQPNGPK